MKSHAGLRRRRTSITALAMVLVIAAMSPGTILSAGSAPATVGQAPGSVCQEGWAMTQPPALSGGTAVDVTFLGDDPWAAGSAVLEGRQQSAFTSVGSETGWTSVPLAPTATASVLTAIATAGANELWAAGEAVGTRTQPMIQHWDGSRWTRSVLPNQLYGGALTDIAQTGATTALAVGYAADLGGQHPLALRLSAGQWLTSSPRVVDYSSLTAVSSAGDGATWAVGWVQTIDGLRPLLERWTGTGWTRVSIRGTGPAALTGVVANSVSDVWAVGYRQEGSVLSALAVHWNGTAWAVVPGLSVQSLGGSILRDVTMVGGDVVGVGLGWNSSSRDSYPVIATWHHGTWNVSLGAAGITGGELIGVAAGPQVVAVGRMGDRAVAVTPCTRGVPLDAGGSRAWSAPDPVDSTRARTGAAGRAGLPGEAAEEALTAINGAGDRSLLGPNGERAGDSAAALPTAVSVPGLEVRDVTDRAGLTQTTLTYTSSAADWNGDGWMDLMIGRHSGPMWVLVNDRDGTFSQPFTGGYRKADRHGCAVGDIDGNGRPDIACAVGANHGLGIKDNEIWLHPLDPNAVSQGGAMGVADPLGRGRRTALFDANHDGRLDLYVANDPSRADGLPSTNRLFINTGGTGFVSARQAGLDLGIGAYCLVPADLDGDGWTDLVLCEYIQMAGYAALRVFHNDQGRFTDVTQQMGITTTGDVDATVGDMDGDGLPDLVRITTGRLEVDLQRNGVFIRAYSLPVSSAQAVTLADVNGDGKPDLYLVRGARGATVQDLLLLSDGSGRRYTSVVLPPAQPGVGGGAVAIDYDRNGRQDLLVMHGNNMEAGPIQLLAFGPPWPYDPPPPSPSATRSASPSAFASSAASPARTRNASGAVVPAPSPVVGVLVAAP